MLSKLRLWDARLGSHNRGNVVQYGQDPTITKRARGLTSLAKGIGRTAQYIFGLAFNSQVHVYNANDLTVSERDYGNNSTEGFMRCMSFWIKMSMRTDGEQLVTGGRDGGVHVWDLSKIGGAGQSIDPRENRQPITQLVEGHTGEVGAVDFGYDIVATCSDDARVRTWHHDIPRVDSESES